MESQRPLQICVLARLLDENLRLPREGALYLSRNVTVSATLAREVR